MIIDEQSNILFFHGKTADYLDPASGEADLNILRMVREDLRLTLSTALRKAFARKRDTIHEEVFVPIRHETRVIHLTVRPIVKSLPEQPLYMVIFEEVPPRDREEPVDYDSSVPDERDRCLHEMEQELQSTREYLQTTIEELETTNEELKSTNEELQSANEELQSTNEEMETAKEELQSVNEELVTVNSELQGKIDELVRANNDLNNLLVNIEIGIVFLDDRLNIQRFNSASTQLINLIDTDIGRPIGHIVSNLLYEGLVDDARLVLDTLVSKEVEVQTSSGQWFLMRIRPYRTMENAIAGLVITFSEITEQKSVQNQLVLAHDYVQNIVSTIHEPLVILNESFRIVSASHSFYRVFQMTPETSGGRSIYEIGDHQWDIPELRELLLIRT
jgi:two-component system CheB/CheR fusion protein